MNTRTQIVSCLMLATTLAACGPNQAPSVETAPAIPAAAAPTPHTGPSTQLPGGIALTLPHTVRQDTVREVKPGVYQRRVRADYPDMDRQQAVNALIADFSAAGYQAVESRQLEDGRTFLVFNDSTNTRVSARVGGGKKPGAGGNVQIHLPAPSPSN